MKYEEIIENIATYQIPQSPEARSRRKSRIYRPLAALVLSGVLATGAFAAANLTPEHSETPHVEQQNQQPPSPNIKDQRQMITHIQDDYEFTH